GDQLPVAMAPLAYRLTDATAPDEQGRFWVINYLWPGNRELVLKREALRTQYNAGRSHASAAHVERLVELQVDADGTVTRVERTPVYLALDKGPRNWEGVVRWNEREFLMVTDKHPQTLLAKVGMP
ncbi:MAG: hypothetical protein AAFS10_26190, partial [Myxococcota bacterium]